MNVCIITYHTIYKDKEIIDEAYAINESTFEAHMHHLYKTGVKNIKIEEINGKPIESTNYIAITFDDGYISDYDIVYHVLKKYNLRGTFFITANCIGKKGFMNWEQIKEISDSGMSIQSHGLNHYSLADLSEKELKEELLISKKIIEDKISIDVKYFSVPGGFHNKRVFSVAENLQYDGACTSVPGFVSKRNVRKEFKIYNRFMITRRTDFETFKALINFSRKIEIYYKGNYLVKNTIRKFIGNRNYQKVWESFFKKI